MFIFTWLTSTYIYRRYLHVSDLDVGSTKWLCIWIEMLNW